jgi:hypothetical protein
MNFQINILHLVYPPISNQEAEWIKSDPDVRTRLKQSNLYMIVQRTESRFEIDQELAESQFLKNLTFPFVFRAGELSSEV